MNPPVRLVLRIAILAVCLLSFGLRFATLLFDFPPGIDWSGDLYSDEGWYAQGAINQHISGQWYVAGDYNTIINVPVFHLVQAFSFHLLGMSLAVARVTAVTGMLMLVVIAYWLVQRACGERAALAAALLLSANFYLFAYSKLAILELPMLALVLLCMLLALALPRLNAGPAALLGMLYGLALLTKTTASFALPALLFLVWLKPGTIRRKALACAGFLAGIGLLYGSYFLWANHFYPQDYAYFNDEFLTPRVTWTVGYLSYTAGRIVWNGKLVDALVYPLTVLLVPLGLVLLRRFRTNPLVLAVLLCLAGYFVILMTRGYLPPRYYQPIAVLVMLLLGILLGQLWQRSEELALPAALSLRRAALSLRGAPRRSNLNFVSPTPANSADLPTPFLREALPHTLITPARVSSLAVLLLALACAWGFGQQVNYALTPKFTYINMVHDTQQRMTASGVKQPLIMGWIAHNISLETGVPALNSKYGTRDIAWKMQTYHPNFYISLGPETPERDQIEAAGGQLELLATYDVLGNYYGGRPVYFYRLK